MAGKALKFVGSIKENRDATNDEIGQYMNMVNGKDGCGGCNGCEGDCDSDCGDDKKDGGCCGCH